MPIPLGFSFSWVLVVFFHILRNSVESKYLVIAVTSQAHLTTTFITIEAKHSIKHLVTIFNTGHIGSQSDQNDMSNLF